jgi:hypothetical protein
MPSNSFNFCFEVNKYSGFIHDLSMKEGSLFCSWDPLKGDASDHMLRVFGKLSGQGGMHGLGSPYDVWTCCAKVLEYWTISSLKIKSNCSWKFQRNWNVPLVLLERSWCAGFNGIYLVRFGFRMWEIYWFFEVVSAAENFK